MASNSSDSKSLKGLVPYLIIALFVIIGGVAATLFVQSINNDYETPALAGETVGANAYEITMDAINKSGAIDLMTGEELAGKQGVIVSMSIKNKTDSAQQFLPVIHSFIRSNDGRVYNLAPVRGVEEPMNAGEVKAGETLDGGFSFVVDDDAEGLQLFIDPRWENSLPVVYRL